MKIIILLNTYLIILSFLISSQSIFAQANKKKPLIKKEIKVLETIKDPNTIVKDDEMKDVDDDDRSDRSEKSDKSDKNEPIQEDKPHYKVVVKNGTILRDKPKLSGKKISIIPEDTIGEILEETKEREVIENRIGNWLKVDYNGKMGWIFSGFTIVKEDKEDFQPLTIMGYFLIKSPEPIFYRKPGREILGEMPNYPEKGDVVPVYRKRTYYKNDYYYFELKSSKPNSEDLVVSWIAAKSGSFLSAEAFSAYTLKSRKKKPKGIEKEIISEMIKQQSNEEQAFNYKKIDIQIIPFKEGTKKKKAYIVGYPTGTKTKNGFGNYIVTYYLMWKEGDNFHSLLAGSKKNQKIQDIDKDGIPEILAQFETKGEPPLCHIYTYQKGMYEQLFPNYLFCDTIQILPDGIIEIQKEKEKTLYKYVKGNLEKITETKPVPVPTPVKP